MIMAEKIFSVQLLKFLSAQNDSYATYEKSVVLLRNTNWHKQHLPFPAQDY